MTIDIRPMIEDVSQVMTKHITNILSGVIGEYTIYKETHDTIMGLPCVRKLQERISQLEQDGSGGGGVASASAASASRSGSREEEVAQLQSAIADLNRYIHALESKVNMKQVSSGADAEESVRLEIHETDEGDDDGDECDEHLCESTVETSSHKNVIITSEAIEEAEDAEAEAEDAEAEPEEADAEAKDAEADAEAAEEAEEEEDAEEEEEDAEEAEDAEAEEAEEEDAEAEEAEEEAEDAEAEPEQAEAEAEDAEAQPEPEPEEEETEEVEEVKIKGKTYFTTNPQNGIIYACVDDDVGDEVGVFKNGVAIFNKGKK
jgi:chemotaxis protein histidine kinase CheA